MNEFPRILMISDRWFPHIGGSETWFHNVYLRRPPGTVSIVTQDYPDAPTFDDAHPQFHMYRRSLKRHAFLKPESLLMLLKLIITSAWVILRRRIQVIHVSKVLNEGFVARLLWKFFKVPYIVFAHGEEITVSHANPKLRAKLVPIFDDATAVIANSSFTCYAVTPIIIEAGKGVSISSNTIRAYNVHNLFADDPKLGAGVYVGPAAECVSVYPATSSAAATRSKGIS